MEKKLKEVVAFLERDFHKYYSNYLRYDDIVSREIASYDIFLLSLISGIDDIVMFKQLCEKFDLEQEKNREARV